MYILVQGHPSASELSGHHRTPSSGQGTKEQASEMKSPPDIFLPAGEPGHQQGRTVTGKQDRTMRISSSHPAGSQLSSPETASTEPRPGAACTGRFSTGSRDCPSRRPGILFPTAGNGVPNRSGTVFPISGDAAPLRLGTRPYSPECWKTAPCLLRLLPSAYSALPSPSAV